MRRQEGPCLKRSSWYWMFLAVIPVVAIASLASFASPAPMVAAPETPALHWYKGNTHVHSRWSTGALDFPEVVADWYKSHGYNFLVLTEHDTFQEGTKWIPITYEWELDSLKQYLSKFGHEWVAKGRGRNEDLNIDVLTIQAKPLAEYRAKVEEPGRFLLIKGVEISDHFDKISVHVPAMNVAELIPCQGGQTAADTLARNLAAVDAQAARLNRPMLAILAHPNWGEGIPIESLLQQKDLRFFEVINSSPGDVVNVGDARHLSTDRCWDVLLTKRLEEGLGILYGVAADDSHGIHEGDPWRPCSMVRAKALTPEDLIAAMNAGDFYATTGVCLKDVRREGQRIVVEIEPKEGVTYVTQFIGTMPGYDRSRENARDAEGNLLPPDERYSHDIGKLLLEVPGPHAEYTPGGQELYVRAKVISSCAKPKADPKTPTFYESAWTQPFVIMARQKR